MIVLALDTSGDIGSVVVRRDGVDHEELMPERRRQGTSLGPASGRALAAADAQASDIQAVAVGIGPGSYTGVRVGVTFAKTLAFTLEVPLVGLSGLMALAHDARDRGPRVAVMAPGHRTRVYGAVYRTDRSIPELERPIDLWDRDVLLAGLGDISVVGGPESSPRVQAATLARLAEAWLGAGLSASDPRALEPLYLQPSAPERK
jgi:tRNA threonylcarbamoyladenosine biosynthesis protein TsaB